MARIRSIKPEFWRSETIAALPIPDRLTFIGLWTYVDDNGVGIDSYKLIASELYGLDDDPREARDNTRDSLARIADAGLIVRYTVAGKRYLYVTGWEEHQRIDRPNKPRYPLPSDPDADLLASDDAADMDRQKAPVIDLSRNPRATLASVQRQEQGNRGTGEQRNRGNTHTAIRPAAGTAVAEPEAVADAPVRASNGTRPKRETEDAFARFWAAYPRREAKQAARKAWDKLAKDPALDLEAVIAAAAAYRDQPARQRAEIRFTPHPATWLNAHRWLDERPKPGTDIAAPGQNDDTPVATSDRKFAAGQALAAQLREEAARGTR